ncbi:crAss001_48 related protein [Comamonas sp. HJ-2]
MGQIEMEKPGASGSLLGGNQQFRQLESAEQSRMRRQLDVMRELSVILGERISAF